jgi:IclR family transcriptional regulator, acetate operon repressor
MPTPSSNTLDKGLRLLEVVIAHPRVSIHELARLADLPPSTAHRMLATLKQRGFVAQAARGDYLSGPALVRLGRVEDMSAVLERVSRPLLEALARRTGLTAHLGVFEADMVTYLVKAGGEAEVFTQEGMQLEAYCSGIGKVLLAGLPEEESEAYLAAGPFVRLTPTTIVEPHALRLALNSIGAQGHAVDDGEIDTGLQCLAAPVRVHGRVCAAISIAGPAEAGVTGARLPALLRAAREIEHRLVQPQSGGSGSTE